jgi:hypothetical protein
MRFLIPISISMLLAAPVLAEDILQIFKLADGGKLNQTQPIGIALAPAHGVSISFLNSGQKIRKAWLSNISFVTLSSDGCLTGLNSECSESGASILYLNRIQDLNIPKTFKTDVTNLTVVTSGSGGGGIYVFKISKSKKPSKLIYEVH